VRPQPGQFGIEEADVEGRVVDHELGAVDEGEELVGHLGKARLVGEELAGQPGDFLGARLERRRVRVEVALEGAPGGTALDQLDAADLDHAVALLPFQAGGFGIEHDLAHQPCLVCQRSGGGMRCASAAARASCIDALVAGIAAVPAHPLPVDRCRARGLPGAPTDRDS
jgi:hypothetical protein